MISFIATIDLYKFINVFMRIFLSYFLAGSLLYASWNNKHVNSGAIAVWPFAGLNDEGSFIEAMIGSDDIAGAHLLKHKIAENEGHDWQTIVFRFN